MAAQQQCRVAVQIGSKYPPAECVQGGVYECKIGFYINNERGYEVKTVRDPVPQEDGMVPRKGRR